MTAYLDNKIKKQKELEQRHREERRALKRQRYAENGGKIRARIRAWEQTPEGKKRIKSYKLKYKYGLSIEDFYNMIASQGGVCAVCKGSNWGPTGPVVDHDHKTGKTRGILCWSCNIAIGHAKESAEVLYSMAEYIKDRG